MIQRQEYRLFSCKNKLFHIKWLGVHNIIISSYVEIDRMFWAQRIRSEGSGMREVTNSDISSLSDSTVNKDEKIKQINEYARQIMLLARDTITVKFRYFDTALFGLTLTEKHGLMGFATDGANLYYDPTMLLKIYANEPCIAVRAYLHILFHMIFFHQFKYDKLDEKCWNIATDIAVENIILDMNLSIARLNRDDEERNMIERLKRRVPELTAEKIYQELLINSPSKDFEASCKRLFTVDLHDIWHERVIEDIQISEELWKKIVDRMKMDLKTFSRNKANPESFDINMDEATRDRNKQDYRKVLERFIVTGEEMSVNVDEFDYIFYTYGLKTYGNMPLIEPLEYKDVKKIKEFVIAIDTSASCRGDIVKKFLTKTFDILKNAESFFTQVNIHIIQCDSDIRMDTKITSEEELKDFVEHGKLNGFGATDFRPVFDYVDELIFNKEFENLKGLIYFTDGYGIYPERVPSYETVFAFLEYDRMRLPVPGWAVEVVMEDELDEH